MKRKFVAVAVIVLNTIILFISLEAFIGILRFAKYNIDKSKLTSHGKFSMVLDLEYAPWVQFKVVDQKSAHTNVNGFLRSSQPYVCGDVKGKEDKISDIYFLGGSTMLGDGVSDDQTIPSLFASILESKNKKIGVRVWNYGQPYYYSTQELFLLFSLIAEGRRPATVIFLDGLNECLALGSSYYRYPFFTPTLKEIFISGQSRTPHLLAALLQKTNLYYALRKMNLTTDKGVNTRDFSYMLPMGISEDECAQRIAQNYLDMIKTTQMLCKAFNIKCYFFWQPVPYYNYDRSKDKICDKKSLPMFAKVFPIIKENAKHTPELYYLGDLLAEYKGSPFLDAFHYSSAFNRRIADEMLKVVAIPNEYDAE